MIAQDNKGLQRLSVFGWIGCALVVLMAFLGYPANAMYAFADNEAGSDTGHILTHMHGEHDERDSQMPCNNPDCEQVTDCENACSDAACALSGSCGSSAVVGPTAQPPTVASVSVRLLDASPTVVFVSTLPESLLRPPIV